ncbi:hypothetical protein [Anabaena sp. CA = ATCC 33047]|uniref:hypothetical protein n=1 Tax=Anabaena sp. (strain CA / ATCC 33047) TaxID=52271 RepID=UPI00082DFAD1|nr:hypothetical protein [Anabaena sp. CA = ATCC 33047]
MVEIWYPMEFEHPSGEKVRVINAPDRVELLAEDVGKILKIDWETEQYDVEKTQRYIATEKGLIKVETMCAVSIFSLEKYIDANLVKRFAHWVRANIVAKIKNNIFTPYPAIYEFKSINFTSRESVLNYIMKRSQKEVQTEVVDMYVSFICKAIPLSMYSPVVIDSKKEQSRNKYLQIVNNLVNEANRYENLYHNLVLSDINKNLLTAQELDLAVFVSLKRLYPRNVQMEVIRQGLITQAINSVDTEIFEEIDGVSNFYLMLLEYFAYEVIA